jgi:hypothetical protein
LLLPICHPVFLLGLGNQLGNELSLLINEKRIQFFPKLSIECLEKGLSLLSDCRVRMAKRSIDYCYETSVELLLVGECLECFVKDL